jgi:hypothetical protein
MSVGEQNERAIARAVPTKLARGLQELLDLVGSEILALASRDVGLPESQGSIARAALMASYCAGETLLSHFRVSARIFSPLTACLLSSITGAVCLKAFAMIGSLTPPFMAIYGNEGYSWIALKCSTVGNGS